jgi:hypothetical protein
MRLRSVCDEPLAAAGVRTREGHSHRARLVGNPVVFVADFVAEAEECVLDLAARLGDRVQVPEWERVAGARHVDDVLGQRAVELDPLELRVAGRDRLLDRRLPRPDASARMAA